MPSKRRAGAKKGRRGSAKETPRAKLDALIRTIRLVAFDFDGVFTDNGVYVFQDATEGVRCFRGDALGLRKLEAFGLSLTIISTETNPVVGIRADKMAIQCVQGCDDKRTALERIATELGISLAQVAYVGNDINDLSCLTSVGLPIVVQDGHPDVMKYAIYRTAAPGGYGAVREVCDLFADTLRDPVMGPPPS